MGAFRRHVAAATALTAACLSATPVVASAQARATVSQGSAVEIGGRASCTIGFNDVATATSYTAAHCGGTGQRVRVRDADGLWVELGTFSRSSAYVDEQAANDWAVIEWDPGVEVASNHLSGDSVVDVSTLAPGDEVCAYGARSRAVACGPVIGVINSTVYWDGPNGLQGDSGGPVWLKGAGLVALYSGFNIFRPVDGDSAADTFYSQRASAPVLGEPVPEAEEMDLVVGYFANRPAKPGDVQEIVQPPTVSGAETGDALSSGDPVIFATIVGIVLTLAVAVLPLLAGLQLPGFPV
ncbi:hypothetical protein [Corynebacterium sp.]|uniref:hypothetical protein n=1 Tax=Corynebacterium sp. TaxID=1720 RepID=UPI002A9189FD|nr:hypothetical protein [Corynebacterium sp.]MDY5785515.1 hypothetical protein [Corynebacterium sp.]